MAACTHRTTCRLCHSSKVSLGVHFEATPPGDVYPTKDKINQVQERFALDLYLCEDCGSVQLLDVIDPSILYGNYIYQTSISLGLPEHFVTYVDDVLKFTGVNAGSFVMDIGSNDGTLLRCFQQRGMKVLGVDPAPAAVKTANERGVETLHMFFNKSIGERLRQERGPVSIVTANNVFANIDNLDDMVEGVYALIEPEGYFVFETGCGTSLFEKNLIDVVYHEHLSYFTVAPLEKFFRRKGMKMIDAQFISTKGGSIRCIVQSQKSKRAPSPSVEAMIAKEKASGMGTKESCLRMSEFIQKRKQDLLAQLDDLKAQGKTIVGYGASVGVTTLLYLFDLDQRLDYLVDDNPARFGLFTPGHHLPVISSKELYERKPDYVLILAWRYADVIQKKHQQFSANGGKWIEILDGKKNEQNLMV